MKHIAVMILGIVTALFMVSCGKAEIPSSPFSSPTPESSELAVSPSGSDVISGKANFVQFDSFTNGEASKDLSYTAPEGRRLQVLIYSSASNVSCNLFDLETFAEWTPEGGAATRVRTGDSFLSGDDFTVEAGRKYNFRFMVKGASGCNFASFEFKVVTP